MGSIMYFDLEIGYENPEIVEKLRNGLRAPSPTPEICKIITIQYQLLDENGMPKTPLRIFREWKSSEEDIIKKAACLLNPRRIWDFIPLGHNIYFDLGMFRGRARRYGINYSEWFIYHQLPTIDIKHILVGMNDFQLKNSGLDKFTGKESSGLMVPVWYHDREYDKILDYVKKEAHEFIIFFARLKEKMPEFRQRHNFF